MILKKISLRTFKCFEDYSVSFDKINLIEGAIGIGKSTILEALIFALYGYSGASLLSDLPTRDKALSCKVTAVIEEKGHIIEVIREFPLKLTIKEDNKTLKMSTSEGNSYLVDKFGTRINFSIFRVLDAYSKEANFLEEGTTTLKKILFAGTDKLFNDVRNNLIAIKLNRERYNRDTTVVYKCYPSEKRLQILNTNLVDISNSLVVANQEIEKSEKELKTKEIKITSNNGTIESLTRQIKNIDTLRSSFDMKLRNTESAICLYNTKIDNCKKQIAEVDIQSTMLGKDKICYVCKKPLEAHSVKDIIKEREETKKKLLETIEGFKKNIDTAKEEIEGLKQAIITEKEQTIIKFKTDIEKLNLETASLAGDIKNEEEILLQDKESRDSLTPKKERIQECKIKLEARLKQKEYIYTEKDVIVVKKAIEELDKLSSVYLVETVHSLEPIINSVLAKIGFEVTFDVDIKGKFNILLEKEGIQYKYKDLSCGQRLILQIALKIALLLQQSKTGLMVSDEGLSALENDNLEDIINLFKELQFQLIFVLHRASIEDPEVNIIKLGV